MKRLLLPSLFLLASCSDYQQGNLREQVAEVEYQQRKELSAPEKLFKPIVVDQDKAIELSLKFNPDIRLQIIRDLGWGENDVELRGLLNPELQLNNQSASLILNVNMIGLYNILSGDERAAWNRMRAAEKTQASADQNQLATILIRDVKLSFLECARLKASIPVLQLEYDNLMRYSFVHHLETDPLFLLTKTELIERIEKTENQISETLAMLIQLIGSKPSEYVSFDFSKALDTSLPALSLPDLLLQAFSRSFTLQSLAARYESQDWNVRSAWQERFGTLFVGPAFSISPGNSSIGLSVKARTLWPSVAADRIKDAEDLRDKIAAEYTQEKHKIEAVVSQLYSSMLVRYSGIVSYAPPVLIENIDEKKTTHYEYLELSRRVYQQELYRIEEIARYRTNEILLESLVGTGIRK